MEEGSYSRGEKGSIRIEWNFVGQSEQVNSKARWSGKRVKIMEGWLHGNKSLPHLFHTPTTLSLCCHFARSLNAKEEWSLLFRFQGTERPTCFRDPVFSFQRTLKGNRPLGHEFCLLLLSQEAWEGQHPLHRRTQPATFLHRSCLSPA